MSNAVSIIRKLVHGYSGNLCAAGIDPGPKTGIVVFKCNKICWHKTLSIDELNKLLIDIIRGADVPLSQCQFWAVENYIEYAWTRAGMHSATPAQVIGKVAMAASAIDMTMYLQTASTIKTWIKADDALKIAPIPSPYSIHEKDALRHLLFRICSNRGAEIYRRMQ